MAWHDIKCNYMTSHDITGHDTTNTLQKIEKHYVLHYVTVRCNTLHENLSHNIQCNYKLSYYITLRYRTMRYHATSQTAPHCATIHNMQVLNIISHYKTLHNTMACSDHLAHESICSFWKVRMPVGSLLNIAPNDALKHIKHISWPMPVCSSIRVSGGLTIQRWTLGMNTRFAILAMFSSKVEQPILVYILYRLHK